MEWRNRTEGSNSQNGVSGAAGDLAGGARELQGSLSDTLKACDMNKFLDRRVVGPVAYSL